ncbi:hypothetical protein Bca4012_057957 [Brassica carinata]
MVSSHLTKQQASPGSPTSAHNQELVQLEPPLQSRCIQPQQDQVAEHSNCYQPRLQNYSLMGCLFHSREDEAQLP